MSKPFIVSHGGGLKALGKWLNEVNFNSYSYSFDKNIMVSLYVNGSGRPTRMAGILVTKEALFDQVEAIVRKKLGWEPIEQGDT